MTRAEFEDLSEVWELVDLADSLEYEHDFYSQDAMDDAIDGIIRDMIRHHNWMSVRDYLDDLPEGYDYYTRDGDDNWYGADSDDADYLKDDLREYMLTYEQFDDDEDDGEIYDGDLARAHNNDTRSAYARERERMQSIENEIAFEDGIELIEMLTSSGCCVKQVDTTPDEDEEALRIIAMAQ